MKIQAKTSEIIKVLYGYPIDPRLHEGANLTFTGGKIYRLGGGWWRVSGYCHSGIDTTKVVEAIKRLKSVRGDVIGEAILETVAKRRWVE